MLHGEVDRTGDLGVVAVTTGVQHLQGHDLGVPVDTRHADAVVARGGEDSCHVRAVAVVVLNVGIVGHEVPSVHVAGIRRVGRASGLVQIRPANAGLERSIPVSSTATMIELVPVVRLQACGASMSVLAESFSPHWSLKSGLLGISPGLDRGVRRSGEDRGISWSDCSAAWSTDGLGATQAVPSGNDSTEVHTRGIQFGLDGARRRAGHEPDEQRRPRIGGRGGRNAPTPPLSSVRGSRTSSRSADGPRQRGVSWCSLLGWVENRWRLRVLRVDASGRLDGRWSQLSSLAACTLAVL